MSQDPFKQLPFLSAGFRSPAEDHHEDRLDFNHYFRRSRPSSIKEYRIKGHCMEGAFIPEKSIVIVDLFLNRPKNGSIVALTLDGEEMVKQLLSTPDGNFLLSAPLNGRQESLRIEKDMNIHILGTVTHVVIDLYYPTPQLIS